VGFAPELAGPQRPLTSVGEQRPGSVRRLTSIETLRGTVPGSSTRVHALALDLLSGAGGPPEPVGRIELSATLDRETDEIAQIELEPATAPVEILMGCRVGPGFRQRTQELLGERLVTNSALHHLLDDWAGAHLVSGFALQRLALRRGAPRRASAADLEIRVNICAGWTESGSIMTTAQRTGEIPSVLGPRIAIGGDVIDAELPAEHWTAPMGGTRRRRRLDLWNDGEAGLRFEEHFRDTYVEDADTDSVLHEYLAQGTIDPDEMVVSSIRAEALVLPWRECPRALGSTSRTVGLAVGDLRPRVRNEFTGTSTCTHLNDTLRALADYSELASLLPTG
jgi:hypothetical protein